jgi:hypothetical protein
MRLFQIRYSGARQAQNYAEIERGGEGNAAGEGGAALADRADRKNDQGRGNSLAVSKTGRSVPIIG